MMPLPIVGLLFISLPIFVEFSLRGIVHECVFPSGYHHYVVYTVCIQFQTRVGGVCLLVFTLAAV